MLTADELYRFAGIEPTGTAQWGDANALSVASGVPGVYVISVDLAPSRVILLPEASDIERAIWAETNQAIVYIGRSINIAKRLSQFRKHKYGAKSPHRGGQAVLLLDCTKTIRWADVADYAAAEDRLIKEFIAAVGRRPYGNRMSSAQPNAIVSI